MFNNTSGIQHHPESNTMIFPRSDKFISFREIDKRIGKMSKHIHHLEQSLAHRHTHGGKKFRERKIALQAQLSKASKKLELFLTIRFFLFIHEPRKIKFTSAEGTVIEGSLKNGKLNGQVTETMANGMIIESEYKNGIFIRQTKIIFPKGEGMQVGVFLNGQLQQGTFVLPSATSEGQFQNEQLNGPGTRTYMDGTIEKGNFKDDQLEGPGKIIFTNKNVAEGTFKNGEFQTGTVTYLDGRVKEFKRNQKIETKENM